MKDLPIGFSKICSFDDKFEIFKDYDSRFVTGKLPDNEFWAYFWSLKSLLFFYCRFIKYVYKKQGIYLDYPIDILVRAGEDGMITDSETWLEYHKFLNHCMSIEDKELRKEAMAKTLDKFRDKVESMLIFMHSDENRKFMQEKKPIFDEICSTEQPLADNPINYSCEELLITDRSYKILLEFFKSYPQIEKVWLHGSRAYGTSGAGSDLDLLFDCDLSAWEEVFLNIEKLLIPYFIDAKNIHDVSREQSIRCLEYWGTKKVYDKKDFQIFWSDRKSFENNSIKYDISKLI